MTVDKGMTERHLIDLTARTCSDVPPTYDPCFDDSCTAHSGNKPACNAQEGSCYWYPHDYIPFVSGGLCSSCDGVDCEARTCSDVPDISASPTNSPTYERSDPCYDGSCCFDISCTGHTGDEQACTTQDGCYWYPHYFFTT